MHRERDSILLALKMRERPAGKQCDKAMLGTRSRVAGTCLGWEGPRGTPFSSPVSMVVRY